MKKAKAGGLEEIKADSLVEDDVKKKSDKNKDSLLTLPKDIETTGTTTSSINISSPSFEPKIKADNKLKEILEKQESMLKVMN